MIVCSIPFQPAIIRPVACCKVDKVARSGNTALAGVKIACKAGFENPKVSVAFILLRESSPFSVIANGSRSCFTHASHATFLCVTLVRDRHILNVHQLPSLFLSIFPSFNAKLLRPVRPPKTNSKGPGPIQRHGEATACLLLWTQFTFPISLSMSKRMQKRKGLLSKDPW